MAYFKVLVEERFIYEVLVKAVNDKDAEQDVLTSVYEWGDPIQRECQTFSVTELEAKK